MRVYLIANTVDGKRYVGKTIRAIEKRWRAHVYEALKRGSRYALHRAIRKYGPEAFVITKLATYSSEEAALRAERFWIEKLGTIGERGYNMCEGGRGTIGYSHSPEMRERLSEIAIEKGRRPSELAIRRSAEVRANGLSAKAIANLTEGQRRRRAEQPVTDEFREKMRTIALARPKGRKASEETKARMRAAQLERWARRKRS